MLPGEKKTFCWLRNCFCQLTGKNGFGRFWLENTVWVDVDQKNWFWSILARKTCLGRFWPKNLGLVNFDRKHWFWSSMTRKTGFGQFWPEKLVLVDFDRKKLDLVDFDRKKLVWVDFGWKNWFGSHFGRRQKNPSIAQNVRLDVPDSMVTIFFSISGPLLLWGLKRTLRG